MQRARPGSSPWTLPLASIRPASPPSLSGVRRSWAKDQIRDRLDDTIRQELASPTGTGNVTAGSTSSGNCPGTASALTVPLVIVCAGIASINPCGLAVLAILLLSVIALQTRRQVLMVGLTYIAAVFLFYFISGLGFLSFVNISGTGISSLIAIAAAAVAIILGLVNIVDAIVRKDGYLLAIPESKKPLLERYIRTATLPAAFVLGVLVGIFELPCAGGIYYLTILGLMSNTMTVTQGIPYLLLFNFNLHPAADNYPSHRSLRDPPGAGQHLAAFKPGGCSGLPSALQWWPWVSLSCLSPRSPD